VIAAWRLPLGAPGIYRYPDVPLRQLTGVRMDVCAFLGVAPRGPARERVLDQMTRDCRDDPQVQRVLRRTVPVAVEKFDDYRRLFGGFEGPGLLAYAVAAFFEQGGRKAYVARIVHDYPTEAENQARVARGAAAGVITPSGPLWLRARNEGEWGNKLQVSIDFAYTPLEVEVFTNMTITVAKSQRLPAGTLLRFTLAGGIQVLRFVSQVSERGRRGAPGAVLEGTLDQSLPGVPSRAELVEAACAIDDKDGRTEHYVGQGLSSIHPQWLGASLCYDSELVFPDNSWIFQEIRPSPAQSGTSFSEGYDAFEDIVPEDFFDGTWTPGDDEPGAGVQCLTELADLSLLVVPDLYSPGPLVPQESVSAPPSVAGPDFAPCLDHPTRVPDQVTRVAELAGLRRDPLADLDEIIGLQSRLIEFADQQQSFIALLDVPPGMNQRRILYWRSKFDSPYAAAYHPWLPTARTDDGRDALVHMPPAAVGAGIIAQRELAFGVPFGPANELAANIVNVDDIVTPARHDELHPKGINVFLRERDGIRLMGARTLTADPQWRQLSVRRLVTMLKRTLEQQTQWLVFEPNNAELRQQIRQLLTVFLRQLFRLGAFKGTTEGDAFFVRCDDELNEPLAELGQVLCLIGVAPAEPLEFIVLRLSRDGDGTLSLEENTHAR
jgi:hypothetical protein